LASLSEHTFASNCHCEAKLSGLKRLWRLLDDVLGEPLDGLAIAFSVQFERVDRPPPKTPAPPLTEAEKRRNAAAYGYTGSLKEVEYDHLVPLGLGGDPNDPRNLWVEPGESPNPKDGIEPKLRQLVCEGRVVRHLRNSHVSRHFAAVSAALLDLHNLVMGVVLAVGGAGVALIGGQYDASVATP
jgi:hypothetical protein